MIQIICAAISGVTAIAVAIIGIFSAREAKKNKQLSEEYNQKLEKRKRENLLVLKMLNATLELSIVCANALAGGHNNGNVEESREAAKSAREAYENFMLEVMASEHASS